MRAVKTEASLRPVELQIAWLRRGLKQPGGKLPLFDEMGQKVSGQTVSACIAKGWAEPWFDNPLKPDWMVCKLTRRGRRVAATGELGSPIHADNSVSNAYFL
ncbi:hypothetical protein [Limibacillus halophilus]|jgi:hypothetical protein